ncbi:unnamed protein product [Nezara viridula]|uniref:C2H2-type domain-containing protein n=1 Tax=Nezara viridula TaxID=85310 RepID=A0A9P0MQZ6_NEZVI|nr:unnamed protein product [Nezara viridula]
MKPAALNYHRRKECGRTFHCPVCSRGYKTKGTERRGSRFYCDCGRKFITISHLRSHQKHECGKTFPCLLCGKHFKTRKKIPLHVKMVHFDIITKIGSK